MKKQDILKKLSLSILTTTPIVVGVLVLNNANPISLNSSNNKNVEDYSAKQTTKSKASRLNISIKSNINFSDRQLTSEEKETLKNDILDQVNKNKTKYNIPSTAIISVQKYIWKPQRTYKYDNQSFTATVLKLQTSQFFDFEGNLKNQTTLFCVTIYSSDLPDSMEYVPNPSAMFTNPLIYPFIKEYDWCTVTHIDKFPDDPRNIEITKFLFDNIDSIFYRYPDNVSISDTDGFYDVDKNYLFIKIKGHTFDLYPTLPYADWQLQPSEDFIKKQGSILVINGNGIFDNTANNELIEKYKNPRSYITWSTTKLPMCANIKVEYAGIEGEIVKYKCFNSSVFSGSDGNINWSYNGDGFPFEIHVKGFTDFAHIDEKPNIPNSPSTNNIGNNGLINNSNSSNNTWIYIGIGSGIALIIIVTIIGIVLSKKKKSKNKKQVKVQQYVRTNNQPVKTIQTSKTNNNQCPSFKNPPPSNRRR